MNKTALALVLSVPFIFASCEESNVSYAEGEIIKIEQISGSEIMNDFAQYNYVVHFKTTDGQLYMKKFISTGYQENDKVKIDLNNGWRNE